MLRIAILGEEKSFFGETSFKICYLFFCFFLFLQIIAISYDQTESTLDMPFPRILLSFVENDSRVGEKDIDYTVYSIFITLMSTPNVRCYAALPSPWRGKSGQGRGESCDSWGKEKDQPLK